MSKALNLLGQQFGRLTVVERLENDKKTKNTRWLCVCSCQKQNKVIAVGAQLVNGNKTSCGCLRSELMSEKSGTHKMSKIKEYRTWAIMIQRCTNKNYIEYKSYGGRGITVCNEWRNSFENFYEDMRSKPEKYTIERVDVNGNYCKENCKWATQKEQARNRRNSIYDTINGVTLNRGEWAEIFGFSYQTFCGRIKNGWSFDQILGYEPKNGKYYYAPNLIKKGKEEGQEE